MEVIISQRSNSSKMRNVQHFFSRRASRSSVLLMKKY